MVLCHPSRQALGDMVAGNCCVSVEAYLSPLHRPDSVCLAAEKARCGCMGTVFLGGMEAVASEGK